MGKAICILLAGTCFLLGQVNKRTTDYGVPYVIKPGTPEGSYRLSGIDNISIFAGKLSVAIPLIQIGARGEAQYTVTVNANLPPWNYELELLSDPCPNTSLGADDFRYLNKASSLWWSGHRARYGPGMIVYRRSGWDETNDISNNNTLYYRSTFGQIVFLAPDGTEHTLYDNSSAKVFQQTAQTYQTGGIVRQRFAAEDGSGMTFEATTSLPDVALLSAFNGQEVTLPSGILRLPNGVLYKVESGRVDYIEDRNGNRLVFEYESFQDTTSSNPITMNTFRITKATDSIGRITTFNYGATRTIDGNSVTVDLINYTGANGIPQEIIIERRSVVDSLASGHSASTSLFNGVTQPGGTNEILTKVPRTVVLANGQRYRILYNAYGEVARIELPSGGAFEYTHGPGFAEDSAKGSFTGGRMLSPYGLTTQPTGCAARPSGNPLWQPFIYRRLLEKRIYRDLSAASLDLTTSYLSNETLGTITTHPLGIRRVASSYAGYITVRETPTGSGVPIRRHHHHTIMPTLASCVNSNAQVAGVGPFEKLQCDKVSSLPQSVAVPLPTEGKEWKTEWGGETAGSFVVKRRTETLYGVQADKSAQACWQRDTELDGIAKFKVQAMFYDRTGLAFPNSPLTTNFLWLNTASGGPPVEPTDARIFFSNLSDTFEYDWGLGFNPTITNSLPVCPTMNTADVGGYSRRRHVEILAAQAGKEDYRKWNTQLTRLPSEITITNGSNTIFTQTLRSYDDTALEGSPSTLNSVSVNHPRGNLTRERIKKDTSTEILTETWFDANGHRTRLRNARGKEATFSYTDNYSVGSPMGGNGFLTSLNYPRALASETALTDSWQIDPFVGMPTNATGKNGAVTSYSWADSLGRLKLIDRTPGNTNTHQRNAFIYQDGLKPQRVDSATDRLNSADGNVKSYICFDGLGREIKTVARLSGTRWEIVDKEYSGFGDLRRVSNPYLLETAVEPSDSTICGLSGSSIVWNQTNHDELGRVIQQIQAGQAMTSYLHEAGQVITTDAAAKKWRRSFDGLGRVISVTEDVDGSPESTTYSYDAADRLVGVTQGIQTRTFQYNWAGQLLSASNPENGTVQYRYDAEGNLTAKIDARGVVSCAGIWASGECDGSGIDGLGRTIRRTYQTPTGVGATQEVVYCFDGKKPVRLTSPDRVECGGSIVAAERGFLTGVGNLASRTEYEHDITGRTTRVVQITEGSPAPFSTRIVSYKYWASDRISETTLPSGRRVVECIDARLRITWGSATKTLTDCTGNGAVGASEAYLSGAEYAAHGAPLRWQLGNGLYEVSKYNEFLQLERKRIGVNSSVTQGCGSLADDQLCLDWSYGGSSNNGNVTAARQWARKTAGGYLNLAASYNYDGRNRLTVFSEVVVSGGSGGGSWGQTNSYDRYGNRWATVNGITQSDWTPAQQSNIDVGTNRITTAKAGASTGAVSYDAAGHMTGHPQIVGSLIYDAEGRLVSGGGATYTYDGEGRRVKRVTGVGSFWYWYGADGGLVAEDTPEAIESGVQYLSTDGLGSTRLVTKGNQEVAARMDYWPFGEEVAASSAAGNRHLVSGYGGVAGVKQRFTGKERDGETGLDYFGARYMSSAQGRFTSPDKPFADQTPFDPQSWNLYSYTRNNPLKYVDRTGEAIETAWDVLNIGLGVASLVDNVRSGNYGSATVDALGVVADTAATVVPFVPGGAGTVIKGFRAADKAVDVAKGLNRVDDAVDATKGLNKVDNAGQVARTGTSGGERAGKPFTKKGKAEVVDQNAQSYGGQTVCEMCGTNTVPAKQSKSGVKPPGNETAVDHIHPRSRGGNGDPTNGQVLCRTCNSTVKRDKLPHEQ